MTADPNALQQYYGSLVRMLYRRTGDSGRAEELARETFARAAATLPEHPRPWLFAAALNLVREDGRRTAQRRRTLELMPDDDSQAEASDAELERRDDAAAVRAALSTLGDRDREALLLKAEGFTYAEIADTLGLTKGSVGATLARARRRLVEAYRRRERGQHAAS